MSDYVFDDSPERIENGFEELGYALALEDEYMNKVESAVHAQTQRMVYSIMGQENISEEFVTGNQSEVNQIAQECAKYRAASMAQKMADELKDDDFREEFYSLDPVERTTKALEKGIDEENFVEFLDEKLPDAEKLIE